MTPFRFLRRPAAWLRAISDYRGTLSPAPNFAYALAARRLNGDDLAGLDLRSWRSALCGAEQIDVATLEAFAARFAGCGFGPHSFTPCYGLAEAALAVTICDPGRPLAWEHVSRDRLASDRVAAPVTESHLPGGRRLCDCGPVVDGTRIRIVGDAGGELADGQIGEIWMAGPSIASGYYNDPDLGAKVVRDGWFATGDLGYLRGGHLFVAGRRKDLIVIRGHNYQPADFESVAAEVPGVAAGRVVAFGAWSAEAATEDLYLLCEKTQASELGDDELGASIKAHVARQTGVLPAVVGLVPRNYIARTTSGKVQRAATKAMFLSGARS
jgi:acyl-CoA synthetase (AMP-forming)/AMP-acid ligase II